MLKIAQLEQSVVDEIRLISKGNKIEISEVIYDVEMIQKIGFESWDQIPSMDMGIWPDVSKRNFMELSCNGKKLLKTTTWDIVDSKYLFPMYDVEHHNFYKNIPINTLVFGEVVTGQIHRSAFESPNFIADQLLFKIATPFGSSEEIAIAEVSYGQEILQSSTSQFITRSFFAFINE